MGKTAEERGVDSLGINLHLQRRDTKEDGLTKNHRFFVSPVLIKKRMAATSIGFLPWIPSGNMCCAILISIIHDLTLKCKT